MPVIAFYEHGKNYLEEISKFACKDRPYVGDIWYIPIGEYPFEGNELKEDRDYEFVTVQITAVGVVPYPIGRPDEPSYMGWCEILARGKDKMNSPYTWTVEKTKNGQKKLSYRSRRETTK